MFKDDQFTIDQLTIACVAANNSTLNTQHSKLLIGIVERRIFVPTRAEPNLFKLCRVQPILYKDTRRKVVAIQVDDRPSENCEEKSVQSVRDGSIDTKRFEKSPLYEDKVHCSTVRIWLELRMSNGLYLSRKNLSYQELSSMIEKLEGLC